MTVGEFLKNLEDAASKEPGRERPDAGAAGVVNAAGPACMDWTAGEDFGSDGEILLRKNCARILHRYLQKVMGVKDLSTGLPSYEEVRDIYDCRICAPHISQVIARGIMPACERGSLRLFEGNREVDPKEALEYICRTLQVRKTDATGMDAGIEETDPDGEED